jgi:hypothetical protein
MEATLDAMKELLSATEMSFFPFPSYLFRFSTKRTRKHFSNIATKGCLQSLEQATATTISKL